MAERTISRADSVANVQSYRLPNRYRNYIILLVLFCLYMTVCTIFYTYYEEWEPSEAMFFVVETMSTVGYGYRHPSNDRSRLFTIFAMIFGVFVVFGGISTALTHRLAAFKTKGKYRDLDRVEEIHKDLHRRLITNIAAIFVALFVAAVIFRFMENWTFIKALYFAVQTATSVGYGDIELGQHGTHVVVGIYVFLSVILLAFAIANITDIYQERKRLGKMLAVAQRMQTLDKLKELDTGHGVPRDTFVLAVLEQLGVLDRENDILPWIKKFEEFDVDNKGFLRMAELEQFCVNEGNIGAAQAQRIRHLEESHGGLEFGVRVADKVRGIMTGRPVLRSDMRASEMATLRSSMPTLGRNSMPTLGSRARPSDVTAGVVNSPLATRSTKLVSLSKDATDVANGAAFNGLQQWQGADRNTSRSSV